MCVCSVDLWFPSWLCVGVGGPMPPARLSGDRSAHLRAALPCGNELHAPARHMPRVKRFGSAAGHQIRLSPSLPRGHFRPRSQSRSVAPAPPESRGGADSDRHPRPPGARKTDGKVGGDFCPPGLISSPTNLLLSPSSGCQRSKKKLKWMVVAC